MTSDADWSPLSVRRGLRPSPPMHVGVPDHLVRPLVYWLEGMFGYRTTGGMHDSLMLRVASAIELRLVGDTRGSDLQGQILAACRQDSDVFLDVLDATLRFADGGSMLREALEAGNSVWTVSEDGSGLIQRVEAIALDAYESAVAPNDVGSVELTEAWTSAYGREADPSDAWDHAIKAVEAVLIPIVCPNQDRATLGHVLGELRGNPTGWKMVLPGPALDHDPARLLAMLELLWPNPDRHASPTGMRSPTEPEARAAVHLAVTLVQWARDGSMIGPC